MPSATTLTLDLSISECEPPPIPRAALRKSRQRPATLAAGMRVGVWRIEREIGRGGMAAVYAAAHTRFGKRAAIKLAHQTVLGPRFTSETFLREARVANLINHPGVCEVFATGTFGGRPYLAMERLSGRSLGAQLDATPLSRDQAFEILLELCEVLGAAHAVGVTHRDLKLDNVFLAEGPGASRRLKLLDWGMARIAGEDDPMRGLIAGTLTYIAPEQVRGEDITPAADIYSLGVLAYQVLFGVPPFASPADLELLDHHLHATPPRPRALWAAISPALEALLLAMLAKRPEDRPNIAEVARGLRTAQARLRPSKLRWLTALTPPRWIAPPVVMPRDVIGRPALRVLCSPRERMAGAAIGVAMTVASVVQLLLA